MKRLTLRCCSKKAQITHAVWHTPPCPPLPTPALRAAPTHLLPCRRGLKLDVADEEMDNKYREQFFNFYDDRLMGLQWAKQPNAELTMQFFRLLALCHTVIPEGGLEAGAKYSLRVSQRLADCTLCGRVDCAQSSSSCRLGSQDQLRVMLLVNSQASTLPELVHVVWRLPLQGRPSLSRYATRPSHQTRLRWLWLPRCLASSW